MGEPQPQDNSNRQPNWAAIAAIVFLLAFYAFFAWQPGSKEPTYDIPYSQFRYFLERGDVVQLTLTGQRVDGELNSASNIGPAGEAARHFRTWLPELNDQSLLPDIKRHAVELKVKPSSQEDGGTRLLLGLLPWIVLLGFYFWFMRRLTRNASGLGRGGELGKFLETPLKGKAEMPKVTFEDVAGQDNAKREVQELVEYLKSPERYTRLGAEVPKGVLLMGAPGTGKTLMAKALAGEAGVPFFSISGSEFIEVFVGVGASRVRKMFEEAKKRAPCIIFIDELDSVGRVRGTGLGGGNDEREQTLNQILAEMDGFSGHEAIIVVAATNRPDVLDPALLRPGRFDRHITLDLPDQKARLAILKVHSKKLPLARDVDMEKIASGTPGFSGADIKNLCNEAAINAVRYQRNEVTMQDFDEMRDRLLLGTVRTMAIQQEERHRLAVHEAGHTLLAYYLPHADPLYKVSIIPRGSALGVTQQLPHEERHTLPEPYLKDRLVVMMGGRVAEKIFLGDVSSGADDDIHQATQLARAMVARWGMSEEIGPVDLRESEEHPFLGREIAQPRRFSESSAKAVDNAVRSLLSDAETAAEQLMFQHKPQMENMIRLLEDRETLEKGDIDACLGNQEHTSSHYNEIAK
ncbi:MAG: ATP-dependent zinc metalloprotease FtsH [Gammaproteobacteria bacterium]|nr:ATP-dependent zinc metalloprotease FtsH [Gammaproteobacteria bacterium]